MVRTLHGHLREVHGGVAVVTFLATATLLHAGTPGVPLLSAVSVLFFLLGAVAAAAVVGALGTGLQRGIAVALGRAGISPRTASAARYARMIAVAMVGVDIVLAIAFTWITFHLVYRSALG